MMVKLIAHVLVHGGGDYLLIQRSKIKRGQSNVYPTYWGIPGGGECIVRYFLMGKVF